VRGYKFIEVIKMFIGKNEPLPKFYFDYNYLYSRIKYGTVLSNYQNEIFLQGDCEKQFFRSCNRAKQKGFNISSIIGDYFIS